MLYLKGNGWMFKYFFILLIMVFTLSSAGCGVLGIGTWESRLSEDEEAIAKISKAKMRAKKVMATTKEKEKAREGVALSMVQEETEALTKAIEDLKKNLKEYGLEKEITELEKSLKARKKTLTALGARSETAEKLEEVEELVEMSEREIKKATTPVEIPLPEPSRPDVPTPTGPSERGFR